MRLARAVRRRTLAPRCGRRRRESAPASSPPRGPARLVGETRGRPTPVRRAA
jgi:hypothetical protein